MAARRRRWYRSGGLADVLIIDDDDDSREAVSGFLSKSGHAVRRASGGREALAAVSAKVPDAILLDVRMPGMDGMAVLDVLRSYLRWASVPVAILTAYPEDSRLRHAAERGVSRVFLKSQVDLADVLAWINQQGGPRPATAGDGDGLGPPGLGR